MGRSGKPSRAKPKLRIKSVKVGGGSKPPAAPDESDDGEDLEGSDDWESLDLADSDLGDSDPELGAVGPAEFIPVAEDAGLIAPLGEWVLRTACEQVKAWQDAGYRPPRMCVNASGIQIRHPSWVARVQSILESLGLSPESLELDLAAPRGRLDNRPLCPGFAAAGLDHSQAVLPSRAAPYNPWA